MSFGKPFRAKPVVLGALERKRDAHRRRRERTSLANKTAGLTALVVLAGLAVTNRSKLPVYYPSCAYARAAGVTPIHRGSPGYRQELDADDDGVACEPYHDRYGRLHR